MLKRIVIDLLVVTVSAFLVVGSVFGYFWLKDRPERVKLRAQTEEFMREEEAIYDGLDALGDIDLQLNQLTLAKLEQRFHQPGLIQAGSDHTTRMGWACGKERCALWFSFLVPMGQEVPQNASPAAIWVSEGGSHNVVIGGVRIKEPVEEMKEYCKAKGFGTEVGPNRITCDKDWMLIWFEIRDRVTFLSFVNQKQLAARHPTGAP